MNLFAGENTMDNAAFEAVVYGRVQGVGFRYYACTEAERLGISGWIRNNPGGEVEVYAEGGREPLKLFLAWLRKGPRYGRVDSVSVDWRKPRGTHGGFTVNYD
ncbi:MAG: acylphosphatase [Treponema sp.]|jgi:acylphosphatase|nr:acylphosphatase [Treponema sp.]